MTLQRFRDAVQYRLRFETAIMMECRGKDAVFHAMEALAQAMPRTAEFEVKWTRGSGKLSPAAASANTPSPSCLHLRATQGVEWSEFNATDFSQTNLLRVTPSSEVKKLARAIGGEVRKLGAVAVHVFTDDRAPANTALKALASLPGEFPGLRVRCMPSLGKAKGPNGVDVRVLRLYVQRTRDPL